MDDELWNVRLNFHGGDNLDRKIGRSDITYMNLLAMIELQGYGINDSMYYVKEKGKGFSGLQLIDGMGKVLQMLDSSEDKMCVEIIVLKGKGEPLGSIPISEIGAPVVYSVDDAGVLFSCEEQPAALAVSREDDDDVVCTGDRKSTRLNSSHPV